MTAPSRASATLIASQTTVSLSARVRSRYSRCPRRQTPYVIVSSTLFSATAHPPEPTRQHETPQHSVRFKGKYRHSFPPDVPSKGTAGCSGISNTDADPILIFQLRIAAKRPAPTVIGPLGKQWHWRGGESNAASFCDPAQRTSPV